MPIQDCKFTWAMYLTCRMHLAKDSAAVDVDSPTVLRRSKGSRSGWAAVRWGGSADVAGLEGQRNCA